MLNCMWSYSTWSLHTLSDDALYLYQVSCFMKLPQRVLELLSRHDLHTEIYEGA